MVDLKELTHQYTRSVTYTYTVEEVYGYIPKIPDGYRFVKFAPPKKGESVVLPSSGKVGEVLCNFSEDQPRLIVEKNPVVTDVHCAISLEDVYGQNEVKIPKGWKYKDFRPPKALEYFLVLPAHCFRTGEDDERYFKDTPRIIVEKE